MDGIDPRMSFTQSFNLGGMPQTRVSVNKKQKAKEKDPPILKDLKVKLTEKVFNKIISCLLKNSIGFTNNINKTCFLFVI